MIAKRNTGHGSGLEKMRWNVERMIDWFKGLRRLRVRYDRSFIIQSGCNAIASAVICFRVLQDI